MRTREEQVEYACQQIVQSSSWANLEGWMRGHILEAEGRAASAEREHIIEIIKEERLGTSDDPTDISYDMAIEHCLAAIRSAAK